MPANTTTPARKSRAAATPRPTGGVRVYEALREAIMALELAPGSALEEGQLCRQYKVSRTPVREALIRLASEGLAELNPNRGARVASLDFIDVVDHYEAMDVFQPITCHFAAVRRTQADMAALSERLARFRAAVARRDTTAIIRHNYDLHTAIAQASHNRCIERGYRQMLNDKLRLAQHGLSGTALADHFVSTARISEKLVRAIGRGDARLAERTARELNAYVRSRVMQRFAPGLAGRMALPAVPPRGEPR